MVAPAAASAPPADRVPAPGPGLGAARRFAYGAFAIPLAMGALPLYVHLPKFYGEVFGVSLAALGVLLLALRAFDAILDPLLGAWSDRGPSRRTLIALSVPVLALGQLLTGKRRPRFRDRLARGLPPLVPGGAWIQAVSVGEVELARRLVGELERRAPKLPLLLTATTATGLALAARTLGERLPVQPCPLDLPGPVRRVLAAAAPRLLVLVETELWPEMLHQAAQRGVPAVVVNARLSARSHAAYRRAGALLAAGFAGYLHPDMRLDWAAIAQMCGIR